jgi:hypothetical protein
MDWHYQCVRVEHGIEEIYFDVLPLSSLQIGLGSPKQLVLWLVLRKAGLVLIWTNFNVNTVGPFYNTPLHKIR